jgi:hypothetical protein
MTALAAQSPSSIFERIVRPTKSVMTPAIAQAVLALKFPAADVRQMNRLLQASKDEVLTPDQAVALENYRTVGRMLDLMQIQARRALGKTRTRK